MYDLRLEERERLVRAIQALYAIPFIDDIEDFVWEAIFSYTKNVTLIDPLYQTRKKLLFDVVDDIHHIGWSIKALQHTVNLPTHFEVVIQRADIFKKARQLGFEQLSLDSPPSTLGEALLKHWYIEKVQKDAKIQGVQDKRICILLKSRDRKRYVYYEDHLAEYETDELTWLWTDENRTGLQGRRKSDGALIFRWYPNQKQLFETFIVGSDAFSFDIKPKRLAPDNVVKILLAALQDKS